MRKRVRFRSSVITIFQFWMNGRISPPRGRWYEHRVLGSKWLSFGLFSLCIWFASGCALGGADGDGALDPPRAKLESPLLGTARAKASVRPEDAVRSTPELVSLAQAALRDLARIAAQAQVPAAIGTLARELPDQQAELRARIATAEVDLQRSRRHAWVRDIRFQFIEDDAQLTRWQAAVRQTSNTLAARRQRAADLLE